MQNTIQKKIATTPQAKTKYIRYLKINKLDLFLYTQHH
jgi:hypothetical protein